MSDRWVVLLAGCAIVGALRPSSVPLVVGALVVLAALAMRHPAVLCLGVAVVVSSLAARSLEGLDGLVAGPANGEITLLSDPTPVMGGVRADARWRGRRLELRATGGSADSLRPRLAGERVVVRGETQPARGNAPWLVARHVAGTMQVYAVERWRPGGALSRAANAMRRTLVDGAAALPSAQRPLYTGLVIGDDRAQSPALADDFRGAGLTHLLAVSGQNVAFALALAGPLLRRLRLWPRLAATVAVVAMFGLMTRFEPSVLRAAAMAAVATMLVTIAGAVPRARVLALTVTALLVVDPLLVRSVGFQLSLAATGAIIAAAPALMRALPGPAVVREPLAVTIAAQVGVAPVLLATFGPLPVAAFPANLLAVPAAGPVMVWGLTGGLVAGAFGGPVAQVVHLPTRPMVGWVAAVARRGAALPLGEMRAPHLLGLAAGLAIAMAVRATKLSVSAPGLRRAGLAAAASSVAVAVLSAQAPPPLRAEALPGVVRWHAGSTDVVVLGGDGGRRRLSAAATLASLRSAQVRSIDLLVLADDGVPASVVEAVESRHELGAIVAPASGLVGAAAPVLIAPRPGAVVPLRRP